MTEPTSLALLNSIAVNERKGEALLGRCIAEERDSGRRLRAEYDRSCGAASGPSVELAELRACMEQLQRELRELTGLRSVA